MTIVLEPIRPKKISEEIVNQIDEALQKQGIQIIRDKLDLGYKGSIIGFMERIGQGNCVILVISDKYLRSPNYMRKQLWFWYRVRFCFNVSRNSDFFNTFTYFN